MNINIKKGVAVTLATLLTMIIAGCEGKITQGNDTQVSSIDLQIGEVYTINDGDKLINDSNDTEIEVTHRVSSNTKEVKIISGSATLLRGNYEVVQ
ncbi:hypothetical protein JHD49_10920 [Sulfurimonas sp. SAG-AH-194-C21]|nr:hypothetical protein [Sulfurimonas sp. SAG-AH-194-C21]MDF1884454.1 hypothetical protein [Sulfurimonas sp. SAG-AH-194-C21]